MADEELTPVQMAINGLKVSLISFAANERVADDVRGDPGAVFFELHVVVASGCAYENIIDWENMCLFWLITRGRGKMHCATLAVYPLVGLSSAITEY